MEEQLVKREDQNFPEKLRSELIKPAVKQLWYRGKLNQTIFDKCAAVVGSRKMSRYGKQALAEIVPRLCGAGYTIVSGLMYGVDQEAHRLTLECGGVAIAVLGYGIAARMEEGAEKLSKQIVETGGLVISEYPGVTSGRTWTFPQRNRIVVGLSDIIVVAEAGEKSGSLNTASWARRMNKPVYAVPGSVFSATSEGANTLVAAGLAQSLTKQALQDVCGGELGTWGQTEGKGKRRKNLKAHERELITLLMVSGPLGMNELARQMGRGVGEVMAILIRLEMDGFVTEERGVWGVSKTI